MVVIGAIGARRAVPLHALGVGMLQIVYHAIVVFIALLVAAVTLRERSIGRQVSGGVVLIILLLRIFMVK